MNVGERKEKAENRTRSASRLSLMKKQRLFKMTDIERNMLVKALGDVSRETGPEESAEILSLMEKRFAHRTAGFISQTGNSAGPPSP